jgi:predicted CXXCH cytochrome family protein
MGRSIGTPEALPAGRIEHSLSGSVITSESYQGQMTHRIAERGITAEYPVAYQIGSGRRGRTFAVQIGSYLEESPISWYTGHGWDVSPGYRDLRLLDADRSINSSCLFCHAGRAKFTDDDGQRLDSAAGVTAITCERCHGKGDEHARHPSRMNIVNPARLTGARRDSVCEQCHLEGDARITNLEKRQEDYRPGDLLEQTIVPYLLQRSGQERPAVSQAEELAQSRCARASGGRLWCGTCHNPHAAPANRALQVRDVCMSCHPTLSPQAHPVAQIDCIGCHMPARTTSNIDHVSVTDHRIHIPGSPVPSQVNGTDVVYPWRPPDARIQQRDLALAELEIASRENLPDLLKDSIRRLEALPADQQSNDPDVLSNLELVYLKNSAPEKAFALAKWAVDSAPRSATFALNLGIAAMRAGRLAEAEQQLLRAIDLNPSLMQAYAELALLYDKQGRVDASKEILQRFLKWNPQSIQFRMALQH